MKKGYISVYTMIILVILMVCVELNAVQFQNEVLLAKYHNKHLIYVKALQLLKQHQGEAFEYTFLNERIINRKNQLQFLDVVIEYEYDKELGILIKQQ